MSYVHCLPPGDAGFTWNARRLRVPHDEAADLRDDLTAWASISGIDPRLTVVSERWKTTNDKSPIQYLVFVNESFFEQFRERRPYIEQWPVQDHVILRHVPASCLRLSPILSASHNRGALRSVWQNPGEGTGG